MDVMLDGVYVGSSVFPGGSAGYTWYELDTTPGTVVGGRHTLAYLIDPYEDLVELDETNNTYGLQYVWMPKTIPLNTPGFRYEPQPYYMGWEYVTGVTELWYNCDGTRTPLFSPETNIGYYGCVAIIPEDLADVDLQLHFPSTGLTTGFTIPLVSSSWPPGHSDFVLMNFNSNPNRQFDAGIVAMGSNGEEIKIVSTESVYSGQDPAGSVGNHWLMRDDIVKLYEFRLQSLGHYRVDLTPLDSNCDLGLSLYGPDLPYYSKSDAFDDGVHGPAISYTDPAGSPEHIDFTIDTIGWYALAVWKAVAEDRADSTLYNLTFTYGGTTGVGDQAQIPSVTRLAGAYPNPFNPMTTVAFELDSPQNVRLEIFDLRGRLVRVLVDESMPAGSHESIWRGIDSSDRNVSSGIYMIRMTAGKTVDMKRVSLLK